MKMKAACGAILLGLLLVTTPARAAPGASAPVCPAPAPLTLTEDPQWIDHGVEVLFDPRRNYRIEEVTGAPLCRAFRPVPGLPAFGVEPRGIWLRLRLPDFADAGRWRLLVRFGSTERFCAHWPLRAGGYQTQCADLGQPLGSGYRARQGWYFPLPTGFDATRPVLLYTEGAWEMAVRLAIGTADALTQHFYVHQMLVGIMFGVMLVLALLGMVMCVVQRERVYGTFSAYVIASLLYFTVPASDLNVLGLAGRTVIQLQAPLAGLAMLCTTLFFQSFLDTRRHTPRLHWLTLVLLIPYFVGLASLPLMPRRLFVDLSTGMGGVWTLALLAMMVTRLRQGSAAAAYGLLSLVPQLIAGYARVSERRGLVLLPAPVGDVILFLGQGLVFGMLAIGLVERLRRLSRERDQARQLALSSQKLALHRAHYDPVTQLPNRARFREDLHERLLQREPAQRYALVTMGLDRFGLLNDALGHDIGDRVLGEIARRLQQGLGADVALARTGADLFTWLGDDAAGIDALVQRCEQLQAAVSAPLRLGGGARLSASVGIALCPEHASSAELLLQYSDAALHRAKQRGAGNLLLFDPAMYQSASEHLELSKALHRALERDELSLQYQPIVSFRTGQLLGVESLARWRRDDGQQLPPDHFVPLTQSGHLLRPFTEWGLRDCFLRLADWQARGVAVPYASFNLSAQQLSLPGLEQLVLDLMAETGAPPERVVLEVTEGTLLENLESTARLLGRFRQRGMAIAVDDFGVGYASPHYLRTLPVDILKLDGVFLRGVPQQTEATSVLDSLITLGQSLNLKIVSECVETGEQAQYLASRGVTGGQGFYFSAALPAAELEAWLQRRREMAA